VNDPSDPVDPRATTIPAPPPEFGDVDDLGFRTHVVLDADAWQKFSEMVGWDGFASEELYE
jgi:hypothetical protein